MTGAGEIQMVAEAHLLACPACSFTLQSGEKEAKCTSCGASFGRVRGALSFLVDSKPSDFKNQWELWSRGRIGSQSQVYGHSSAAHLAGILGALRLQPSDLIGKSVLDAGCGHGLMARAFAAAGAKVVGMDLTGEGFVADGTYPVYVFADYLFAPFPPLSFDVVISSGVAHHIESPFIALANIARFVRKGGLLYLYLYEPRSVKSLRIRSLFPFSYRLPKGLLWLLASSLAVPAVVLKRLLGRKGATYRDTALGLHDVLAPQYSHEIPAEQVVRFFRELGFAEAEKVGACTYRIAR